MSLRGSNATAAIPQTKYVILSASEISHRTIALIVVIARHEVPRQSVGVKYGVYAANFIQGDRHACARDDTENQLSLRQCQESNLPGGWMSTEYILRKTPREGENLPSAGVKSLLVIAV